jgi:hypothetical protein
MHAFVYDAWNGQTRRDKPAWWSVSVTRPARLAASSPGSAYAAAVLRKYAKHVRDLQTAFDRAGDSQSHLDTLRAIAQQEHL